MTTHLSVLLLLLASPALALTAEEQHREGEAVIVTAAERQGLDRQVKDALRSLGKGRDADSRRWAACWCFEAEQLGPEHAPGCHWLAAFRSEAGLSENESRTVRFCADRP